MSTEPVGLSKNLPPQRVMRAFSGGHDLAVWRSASGELSAWGNRCPHRGMRLSYGFVRGESLACAYHGWHFNCEATCHYMPAHPKTEPPGTIKPEVFSVTETDGMIWVNTAGNVTPPAQTGTGNHSYTGVRSIAITADMASTTRAFLTVACANSGENTCDAPWICVLPVTGSGNTPNSAELNGAKNSKTEHSQPEHSQPEQLMGNVQTLLLQDTTHDQLDSIALLHLHHWQPNIVMAHILARTPNTTDTLLQLSRWAELVRREAEYATQ